MLLITDEEPSDPCYWLLMKTTMFLMLLITGEELGILLFDQIYIQIWQPIKSYSHMLDLFK